MSDIRAAIDGVQRIAQLSCTTITPDWRRQLLELAIKINGVDRATGFTRGDVALAPHLASVAKPHLQAHALQARINRGIGGLFDDMNSRAEPANARIGNRFVIKRREPRAAARSERRDGEWH